MSVTGMPLLEDELLTGVVTELPYDPRAYPLLELFPREGGGTDKITWESVVGERGMAELTTLDAEGHMVSRDAVKKGSAEPAYTKEYHRLLDSELSLLREPGAAGPPGTAGNPEKAERARNRMLSKLRARQQERWHWMCCQALSTGGLSYAKSGLAASITFGFPTLTAPSPLWGQTTATPIRDIRGWIQEFSDLAGYPPDAVLYNPKVLERIEKATEWKDLIKVVPGLAQQVLDGSTKPMVIGTIPLVWIPVTGKYVDDDGDLKDRWDEKVLTFVNLQVNEGLPFGNWMVLENNQNGYSANPAAWSWEGEGTAKGQVSIAVSDNGLPVVYNQKRVQRVTVAS